MLITAIFIFLTLNTVFLGGLISYNYKQNGELVQHFKAHAFANSVHKTTSEINDVFRPVYELSQLAEHLSFSSSGVPLPIESLTEVAHEMNANPQITSVFFASANDEFIQISSVPNHRLFERGKLKAPWGAAYAIRHLQGDPTKERPEVWSFLDRRMQLMKDQIRRRNLYNPDSRPWYKAAMGNGGLVISEPYPFLSVRSVGITASRQVNRGPGGIFAINLTLDSLSSELMRFNFTPDSSATIFTKNGNVLAKKQVSGKKPIFDGDKVVKISETHDPVLRSLFAAFFTSSKDEKSDAGLHQEDFISSLELFEFDEGWIEFQADGREYVGRVSPLVGNFSTPTYLGYAALKDTLLNEVDTIFSNSIYVSVAFLLISALFTAFIVRFITAPISKMADDTERIQRFDLSSCSVVSSRFSEIDKLGHSLAAMKNSLRFFKSYVPEVVVRKLIQDDCSPELGGETREVTIMFTDAENFTSMSELMSPFDLMRKLSAYLECFSQQVRAENGIVDKFIGDSVMAVWNSFDDEPNHAERACIAALRCCEANDKLNEMWREIGWPEMHSRIGLHTGAAVVGNIGSSERMEHTTIGANVNSAARMEGLNKTYGTRLLVSETVYHQVIDKFLMRPVDFVVLRGSSKPIEVYELAGTNEDCGTITATDDLRRRFAAWQRVYDSYRTGDWTGALTCLDDYLAEYPDDPVAQNYLSIINDKLSEPDDEVSH